MASPFLDRLAQGPLLADGAMGTLLFQKGIPFELCFDELNVSNPALVEAIHREYLAAGAELIETNTFGANAIRLASHGLDDKARVLDRQGVKIARNRLAVLRAQNLQTVCEEHAAISEAIRGRAPERARDAMLHHIEMIRIRVERLYGQGAGAACGRAAVRGFGVRNLTAARPAGLSSFTQVEVTHETAGQTPVARNLQEDGLRPDL